MLLKPFVDAVHLIAFREPACNIKIIAVYFVICGSGGTFNSGTFKDIQGAFHVICRCDQYYFPRIEFLLYINRVFISCTAPGFFHQFYSGFIIFREELHGYFSSPFPWPTKSVPPEYSTGSLNCSAR